MGAHKQNPRAIYYTKHPEYKGKDKRYLDVIDRTLPVDLMEWQSGAYRFRPECQTETGYYGYVGRLVVKYGEFSGSNMTVYRSILSAKEDSTHLGYSWTPSLEVCREKAAYFGADGIYSITIPAGTPVIHLEENGFYEEEYILDMNGLGLVGITSSAIATRSEYGVEMVETCPVYMVSR